MKLRFIGVGGAFAPISKGQSNMYLESDSGKRLLIDCGATVPYIVRDEWGMSHQDFEGVYVSHLHADHIGGLEYFALMHKFMPANGKKPKLYGRSNVLTELWSKSLRGGLETLEGEVGDLNVFFDVRRISANGEFNWEGYNFKTVQTNHISDGFEFKHSYGLLVQKIKDSSDVEYGKTFITTDTQFCPSQLLHTYKIADTIFHDCETLPFKSGVHAHYDDLCTLDTELKNKMWLYHYSDKKDDYKEQGFQGFVEKGQEFKI